MLLGEVGQLWELSSDYNNFLFLGDNLYVLIRRIGYTNVWEALSVNNSRLICLTLSSNLYKTTLP